MTNSHVKPHIFKRIDRLKFSRKELGNGEASFIREFFHAVAMRLFEHYGLKHIAPPDFFRLIRRESVDFSLR